MKLLRLDCVDFLGTTLDGRSVNLFEFENEIAILWHIIENNCRKGISCRNLKEPLDFTNAFRKPVNKIPFHYILNATNAGFIREFAHKWLHWNYDRRSRWLANFYPQYKRFLYKKLYSHNLSALDIWL